MVLLHSTSLYMAPLDSTRLYLTLPWHYFTLYSSLYITLPWLYFTQLYSTYLYHGSTSRYFSLHYSTMALLHCTLLYLTLPWLYFTLLYSTLLYHGCASLYFTLHCSTSIVSTSLHVTQHYSTMDLLHSTLLHIDST